MFHSVYRGALGAVLEDSMEHLETLEYRHSFVIRQEDGSPLRPDSMSQKWRRFLEENNLPSIRFHDLRHSNATALIQAGVNPRVVQQRLGHSDVNITLNTYTHVLPEMDIDAAEKLDFIMLKKA